MQAIDLWLPTGCYTRATLFGTKITDVLKKKFPTQQFPLPYKQFVYGSLTFNTENAIPNQNGDRQVSWTMHVAPVIRLAAYPNFLYILDPAVSAEPILRKNWEGMLIKNPNTDTTSSTPGLISGRVTCMPSTLTDNDDCFNPVQDDTVLKEQTNALLES